MDDQSAYVQLGRLLGSQPDLVEPEQTILPDVQRWLGRVSVLVERAGNLGDAVNFRHLSDELAACTFTPLRFSQAAKLQNIAQRALAVLESRSPGIAGSFIPVGNEFDAFAAIGKLLGSAKSDLLIVDPYLDETVLTDFALSIAEGVNLRLLAGANERKASLEPAVRRWMAQHGAARPLSVRLAKPKTLHDRAIFIDNTEGWTLTQSLNAFAKRSPAEIIKATDTSAMKIPAYEAIWSDSTSLV